MRVGGRFRMQSPRAGDDDAFTQRSPDCPAARMNIRILDGQIDCATDGASHSPAPFAPQAPGFDKAEGSVSQGTEREQTELRVRDVEQQPREDVRMRIRGIEVKMTHEFVGDVLGVKVREPQQPASTEEHERAFGRPRGNGPE